MTIDLADLMWAVVLFTVLVIIATVAIVRTIDRQRDRIKLPPDWFDEEPAPPGLDWGVGRPPLPQLPFMSANEVRALDRVARAELLGER